MSAQATRVLLADDHRLVRAGIRALLEGIPGIEVVAEASDGQTALEMIRTHQPQLVFLDIAMPGTSGLEALRRMTDAFPDVLVVILTMHDAEEYVCEALRAGAAGYLLKDAALSELEVAVQTVLRGETYLTPAVSKHVIADYVRRAGGGKSSRADLLSPRQREVLKLIAVGKTTKEIAAQLHISAKTVETHRGQLMERLEIHDIAGLVRYAIHKGLIPSGT